MKVKFFGLRSFVATVGLSLAMATTVNAGAVDIELSGLVVESTGAFTTLLPPGTTMVSGPVTVDDAALAAGLIGPGDVEFVAVRVGNFCFATQDGPNPPPTPCGDFMPPLALVPVVSIDAAAITGTSGVLGGTFDITAFSPTFNVTIPILFDLDNQTFSADGGALGTVAGTTTFTAPSSAAPEIETDPVANTTLAFGEVAVGSGAVTETIMVTNTGTDLLTISAVNVAGAPADLVVTNTCDAAPIAASGTCTVTATLTPATSGDVSATITIVSDDADESSLDFPVTASIRQPASLSTDATSGMPLMIASAAIGETTTGLVTITNTGEISTTLGTATMPSAPFALTGSDMCSGQVLAGGADCTIEVSFTPTTSSALEMNGTFESSFSIAIAAPLLANGGASTSVTSFVVSSTDDPVASPSADPLMIADTMVNNTMSATLTITNTGADDLVITGATIAAPFAADASDCTSAPIAPAGTCAITVDFSPTVIGAAAGTLTIASNDPVDPSLDVAVMATGTEEELPNISVDPAALNFAAPVLVGAMEMATIEVSNMGNADLAINSIALNPTPSADFSIADDCVSPLAPMATCTITVTFAPSTGGALSTSVVINSDDPDSAVTTVMVTGTGVIPEANISLSTALLDLGVETIGSTTDATVTVTNTGTANLDISSVTIPAGAYTQVNDCLVAPLAPMGSCTITVTFAPTVDATITDTLTIVSNDPDSMMSTVSLTGRGVTAPEPNIAANVMSLDLGNGLFGDTIDGAVEISNNGSAVLTISAVTIGGADAGEFVSGGDCVGTVAVGATCMVTIQFSPAAPEGMKSATLSIASDDADTPSLDIPLSGSSEMPVPAPQLSPGTIDFNDTVIGDTDTQTQTITNVGTGALTIASVLFIDQTQTAFAIMSETCTAAPIAVNADCSVVYTFTPGTAGDFETDLELTSDGSPMFVPILLRGTGIEQPAPDITVDMMTLAYGSVPFNETGVLSVTVTNAGDADLTVSGVSVAPMGEFTATTACGVLAPAATCTVEVTYAPTIAGDVTATLSIASDDADTPSLDVALTGTGVPPLPEIELSATDIMFGSIVAETTATMDVTVNNTGMADLVISSITISGVNQALFSESNDCATIAMNASCTITVTYAPDVAGDAVGTLTIVSNDADEPSVEVSLAGTATPVPMPMLDVDATLDLGDVSSGQTGSGAITVNNLGSADLVISDIAISGANIDDFAQTNDCATVAAGASCTVNVEFTPASDGAATVDVVITSNDGSSPATVTVTANGLVPVPMLSATTLDLGGVRIGESGEATVTITNTGSADLIVISAVVTGVDAADFELENGCGTVAAGASCNITASFAPNAEGAKMAAITVTTNDPALATFEVPLNATGSPMEEIVVTVSSQGGSGSFGWLELVGLGLLVGFARNIRLRSAALVLAAMTTPMALADDHGGAGDAGYWYAGAGFGSSDGQADLGAIERGIEEAGVTVTSLNIDDSDSGFKVFAGYQATKNIGVEIGYVDLGEAGIDLQLGAVALDDLPLISRAVSGNLSLLGNGVTGSVVVRQPIGDRFGVMARVGLVSWEVDTAIGGGTSSGVLNIEETESGTDFMFGVGAEAWFGAENKLGVRGEWERYELGNQDAEFLSLSLLYRF